ncbi:prepilin-type N-terminal cleavage/methylation domain-containing protein [Vibrio vulnificus]|uniref:prepilin-type N-terminal cleavage/methylation domain-containing protein n=1 Tax=Vibrio vulnificus TaxID=672 RepID=UPI00188C65A9|nr:prepilin-type N-terminal cleavage/methylation domain-containing protein [Vibrio vulnificus]MBF4449316.1 prepilin-type N-terminal cleavage/methylation domain-containing protein [Vibrio vulnificus]MBF4495467.1 prepilin-type N-terminal cleavage/methylation domain-containing protein [Vibrio vulnificus]MBL6181244.1 prepilin-type N-terminal cleavage/methylation domain-containing protein [Vibrio vulnificus]MCA4021199.1 prepilin-type N-terminal cleavage/methylation domain-containing protein [Vibrio 
MKYRQTGFTLIEMVVVLVLIAIVSAVAAVRFLGIQADARSQKVRDMAGQMRTAVDMVYAKSAILGVESSCNYIQKVEVESYYVCHGYPIAYIDAVRRLLNIDRNGGLHINNKEIDGHRVAAISFYADKYTFQTSGDFCQILYQPEKQPQIVSLTDGC